MTTGLLFTEVRMSVKEDGAQTQRDGYKEASGRKQLKKICSTSAVTLLSV